MLSRNSMASPSRSETLSGDLQLKVQNHKSSALLPTPSRTSGAQMKTESSSRPRLHALFHFWSTESQETSQSNTTSLSSQLSQSTWTRKKTPSSSKTQRPWSFTSIPAWRLTFGIPLPLILKCTFSRWGCAGSPLEDLPTCQQFFNLVLNTSFSWGSCWKEWHTWTRLHCNAKEIKTWDTHCRRASFTPFCRSYSFRIWKKSGRLWGGVRRACQLFRFCPRLSWRTLQREPRSQCSSGGIATYAYWWACDVLKMW